MNVKHVRRFILSGIFLFFHSHYAHAQTILKGKVLDVSTGNSLPFVQIQINDDLNEFIANIDGNFEIALEDSIQTIRFSHYLFRTKELLYDSSLVDSFLIIPLVRNQFFEFNNYSSDTGLVVINQVIHHKKENGISGLKNLSYRTYNKATFTPEKVENTNTRLNKIAQFFSVKINSFKPNQHFLILESATKKKIYDKHFHKEEITGARSTILDVPSLFIQTTQIQSFSPYENYINVGGKLFVSPLATHTTNRYSFRVIDTIYQEMDTVYVVKFNPFPKKQFDGLKGLFYINTKNYAVQYFIASPAQEKKLQLAVLQSYQYYPEDDFWFFHRTKTIAVVEKSGENFVATLDNYVYKVDPASYSPKKEFDEIILKYPSYANQQPDSFWIENRRTPLTLYDSNTYVYYDSADQKKLIQRTLKFGEHLYFGVIEYKFLDLDFNRFLDINQVEAVRIGIGAHTNDRFSKKFILGGYFGYGFRDQENKFGLDASYKFRKIPLVFTTAISHDLRESGGVFFPFNKYQYSTESLRRIRLRIMDMVTEWETSVIAHPIRYLDIKTSFSVSRHETTYDYSYRNVLNDEFDFTELRIGLRYSYGEQFIQLLNRKISVKTPFPVFYFQFTKGFENLIGGDHSYDRYDTKLEYTFEVLDWGTTGIQLAGGIVTGDAPYMKLYNNKGSSKNPSVVTHNSFETMHYNEFLSDKYIALFLSHNFGRFYFKSRFIKPSLLLLHNIGFGGLKHPERHTDIDFKTMEKGYIESGMLLNEIVVFKITGLNVGLGTGFFLRYGPYRIKGFENNIVVKFAIKFSL